MKSKKCSRIWLDSFRGRVAVLRCHRGSSTFKGNGVSLNCRVHRCHTIHSKHTHYVMFRSSNLMCIDSERLPPALIRLDLKYASWR